jgi:hypothetical protein
MNAHRSSLSVRTPAHRVLRSFRNVLRHFVVLGGGLLLLTLPGAAFGEELATPEDDDPFDRSGFYFGLGGTYQRNVFESKIEDLIQDEVNLPLGITISSVDLDDSGGFTAQAGYRAFSFLAAELQYEWIDEYSISATARNVPVLGSVSGDLYSIEGHTLTANTKWIIPFWRIQPYLLLGGGFSVSKVDEGSLLKDPLLGPALRAEGIDVDDGTNVDFAGRAGLGLDLYITQNILINTQGSVVVTTLRDPKLSDIDDLNYMAFSAGLQYRF